MHIGLVQGQRWARAAGLGLSEVLGISFYFYIRLLFSFYKYYYIYLYFACLV